MYLVPLLLNRIRKFLANVDALFRTSVCLLLSVSRVFAKSGLISAIFFFRLIELLFGRVLASVFEVHFRLCVKFCQSAQNPNS